MYYDHPHLGFVGLSSRWIHRRKVLHFQFIAFAVYISIWGQLLKWWVSKQQPWVFLLKMIHFGVFGDTSIWGNTHIHMALFDNKWICMYILNVRFVSPTNSVISKCKVVNMIKNKTFGGPSSGVFNWKVANPDLSMSLFRSLSVGWTNGDPHVLCFCMYIGDVYGGDI